MIKPCLLIPIYNHKDSIGRMVERLLAYRLPILIVDDGSDAATQETLRNIADSHPAVHLFRLSQNGGKGAAVMHGMRQALKSGFSHALQIDADGQHDTDDVPAFIAAAEAAPQALICGQPVYDASIPKGRLYGRSITHFWVRIETLSMRISDAMCGFRLYPLQATCALIDRVAIRPRMDFDIEIMVRLAWRGVRLVNIPTRVVYPEDGVSHFNMLRDNLRISRTHAKLFFGMLWRSPLLVARKLRGDNPSVHWSRIAERGSGWGLRIVFACHRLLGERTAQWLLYPVVGYFLLTNTAARRASLDYLRRLHVQEGTREPGWGDAFRHMLAFAQSGLDKLSAWSGRIDASKVDFPARAEFDRLLASGRGALLVGAHLGNLEMTRALANANRIATVNAVVYTQHAQQFNRILEHANADFGVNLLQVSALGPDTAILLREKIDNGELLVIVGDRTPPAENGRISHAEFLGAPAAFANGPWILASLLDCPVYLFFCLREGDGYRIHFERFADRITLPRQSRTQQLQHTVRQYAARLEAYCRRTPYQWFNFYDFWRSETSADTRKPLRSTE